MVCIWSWLASLSVPSPAATGPGHADPRSTPTPPAGASGCAARSGRGWSPPGGLRCREPAPGRAAGDNPAGPHARADEYGGRPWARAWHLRGELPYGQGGYGLGQAQLPGDRLGRSPGRSLGDAAGDRQGRPSCSRRHRRGDQGSAAGYLGAIGGRLHAVRSQAAARLASNLADAQAARSWFVVARTSPLELCRNGGGNDLRPLLYEEKDSRNGKDGSPAAWNDLVVLARWLWPLSAENCNRDDWPAV
jgi:hypothetical protein